MTVLQWIVALWVGVPLAALAFLIGRDWWRDRTARRLEALYRMPTREPRMRA